MFIAWKPHRLVEKFALPTRPTPAIQCSYSGKLLEQWAGKRGSKIYVKVFKIMKRKWHFTREEIIKALEKDTFAPSHSIQVNRDLKLWVVYKVMVLWGPIAGQNRIGATVVPLVEIKLGVSSGPCDELLRPVIESQIHLIESTETKNFHKRKFTRVTWDSRKGNTPMERKTHRSRW